METLKTYFIYLFNGFHRCRKLHNGLNFIFIALITKGENLVELKYFWPNSLVGVCLQDIGKKLSKQDLGDDASDSCAFLGAFVRGGQLLDGVFIVDEMSLFTLGRKQEKGLCSANSSFSSLLLSVSSVTMCSCMVRISSTQSLSIFLVSNSREVAHLCRSGNALSNASHWCHLGNSENEQIDKLFCAIQVCKWSLDKEHIFMGSCRDHSYLILSSCYWIPCRSNRTIRESIC